MTAAAAAVAKGLPANTDYRTSIINAPGATAYPISSMTWALIDTTQRDDAPLPPNLVTQLRKRLGTAPSPCDSTATPPAGPPCWRE